LPAEPASSRGWKEVLPFLVVEVVSPDYRKRDYIEKWRDYHDARIPEYWIVDGERRHLLALRWTPGDWELHKFEGSGVYTTPLLPGLELDVVRLWL
jgi:Uma2 family endonuclease